MIDEENHIAKEEIENYKTLSHSVTRPIGIFDCKSFALINHIEISFSFLLCNIGNNIFLIRPK